VWRGKLRKRDGQMLLLSNAGEPGGVYESVKTKAVARCHTVTRDGAHEVARGEHFVLHRHALEEGQDVEDLDLVETANPLRSLTRDKRRAALESESFDRAHWSRMSAGCPCAASSTRRISRSSRARRQRQRPPGPGVMEQRLILGDA
jgi:hypothetical protein